MSHPTLLSENVVRFFGEDKLTTGGGEISFKKAKLRKAYAVVLWENDLPKILAVFWTEDFARKRASVDILHGEVTVTPIHVLLLDEEYVVPILTMYDKAPQDLVLYDSLAMEAISLRTSGLAKLTYAEKKALGLA